MQISSFKTVKTRITSGEGECPCKRARTSRILASSRESRSKPGPMPSFPFNNWQPRFYTSMQIKHKTPFIWLGLPPTTAKGKTGFSKAVFFFRPNPITLLNLLKLVFLLGFWGELFASSAAEKPLLVCARSLNGQFPKGRENQSNESRHLLINIEQYSQYDIA